MEPKYFFEKKGFFTIAMKLTAIKLAEDAGIHNCSNITGKARKSISEWIGNKEQF